MNIPTTVEIRDSIINAWETRLSAIEGKPIQILQSLTKSVLFILATVIAPPIRILYLFVQWALNQTDPQTADDANEVPGGRLQDWGDLVKIGPPKPGQPPRYEIALTGINGSVLLAGTGYKSANGNLYLLEDDIIIALGTATGNIKASVPAERDNTEYALNPGDEVNTVNPYTGINNPALITAELTAPTNAEDIEDSYRPRVVSRVRQPADGGTKVFYKTAPLDAEGVQDAFPYNNLTQPNVIDVYIEATTDIDEDGVPTQAVLDAALEAIYFDPDTGLSTIPDVAIARTFPIVVNAFDIDVVGLLAPDPQEARDRITEAIENTLKNKKQFIDGAEPLKDKNDIVSRAELLAVAVATITPLGGTIQDLTLELASVPIDTYRLTLGNQAKSGGVSFS